MSSLQTVIADLDTALVALEDALVAHPSFNAQEAVRMGKLFYMTAFVVRTRSMLTKLHITSDAHKHALKQDVMSRCMLQNLLCHDTTGKLDMMSHEDPSNPIDFGDEIREKSKAAGEVAEQLEA
ncbi:hypothetical protein K402DRAFT_399210 [Aulographum hederae CBS 113979]|uniref:Uncharacterized protein n=1 Tax=Aulographum hederae CBS 113979 TaxID=1176131 RepID=A0A6G1GIZ7_9PEZI|nr:hypothetical protein K402DRAFT_399210 [Aulographum hederae CBS 113979]